MRLTGKDRSKKVIPAQREMVAIARIPAPAKKGRKPSSRKADRGLCWDFFGSEICMAGVIYRQFEYGFCPLLAAAIILSAVNINRGLILTPAFDNPIADQVLQVLNRWYKPLA